MDAMNLFMLECFKVETVDRASVGWKAEREKQRDGEWGIKRDGERGNAEGIGLDYSAGPWVVMAPVAGSKTTKMGAFLSVKELGARP